jgi:protein tyrosine phosphatase (PTP) superfamily phosphohydrolase (DUF442 family)
VKLATEHLPNAVQLHPRVISGGLPAGKLAFEELAELGVTTIISVDGAKPDVEAARALGLRYIHLPHGYDSIPERRGEELGKAVLEHKGRIYIHCHHGKHRSPAAATVACITAGMLPPSAANSVLELAGTSPHYRGLYRSAQQAQPISVARLQALQVDFREAVDVPPLATAMVALEGSHDDLLAISKAGWKATKDRRDLGPIQAALLLEEHFNELLRSEESEQTAEFLQLLQESAATANQLKLELIKWRSVSHGETKPPPSLSQLRSKIGANCQTCHQQFRDAPEEELGR